MASASQSQATNSALLHMNTFDGGVATMRRPYAQAQQARMGALPRKKLYEQANMVRKVKFYLAQLHVIDNESELDRLSTECEAGAPTSTSNLQKRLHVVNDNHRHASPSPSQTSTLSNLSDPTQQRKPLPASSKYGTFLQIMSTLLAG
jgi:hypothetical protein